MTPAPHPQTEWTYEISWLDGDGNLRFGEYSEAAGEEQLAALKKTCGAFSHRMIPASGGPIIRSP